MVVAPIAIICLLGLVLVLALRARTNGVAARSGVQSDMAELDRLRRQIGAGSTAGSAVPQSQDITEAERELSRLREKYNIDEPGGNSSPKAGAPITFDQYQRGERVAPMYQFH